MGVNANRHNRAHRLCCQPDWPIHLQMDWTPFRKFWKFCFDRNAAGDYFFEGFGLWLRIRPRCMMATWERKRLGSLSLQRWSKKIKIESRGGKVGPVLRGNLKNRAAATLRCCTS